MSWLNIFSGVAQRSAFPEYELIEPTADVTLVWPTESQSGVPYVADWIDVNSTGCDWIKMPSALQAATGVSLIIANIGTDAFELQDSAGNEITMVDPGTSWVVLLTDNTTAAGAWRVVQLGAFTSDAQAGALAGAGLEANLTLLRSKIATTFADDTNLTLTETHRANAVVLQGPGSHIFQLSAIGNGLLSTLKPGWWCMVTNESLGTLTIDAAGADTINNGLPSFDLPPATTDIRYSATIVCSSTGFHVFGAQPIPVPITAGGTGGVTELEALTNFGGTATGIAIFTAPTAAAVLALLGVQQSLLVETTVAVSQTLVAADSGKIYVCTADLTINLPEAGTVGTDFFIGVLAQGGDVTIDPPAADKVNTGSLGAPLVMKQGSSSLIVNDGASPNGTWWTLFLDNASGVWAIAGGVPDAITATYDPPIAALTDGLLLYIRAAAANVTATPTFNPDSLGPGPITKLGGVALSPGDISGANFEGILRYNLANTRYELLNPAAGGAGGGIPWAIAGGTADVISANYSPAIVALTDGLLASFRAIGANTVVAPTFQPNAVAARPMVKLAGQPLVAGDIAGAGYEAVLRYDFTNTRWEFLNPAFTGSASGGGGGARGTFTGLRVTNNAGSPNSQIDVVADSVGVAPVSGTPAITRLSVAVTINALTVGVANGLDAGSLANDTWYAVYVISDGTTTAGLVSSNFTSPTLPAGYTYFGRVGAMRTNGSAQFRRTLQYGRTTRYTEPLQVMATGPAGSVTIPNWIAVSVSSFAPTTASEIALVAECAGTNALVIVAPNSVYGGYPSLVAPPPVNLASSGASGAPSILAELLLESSNIYWASQVAASLFAYGWTENL